VNVRSVTESASIGSLNVATIGVPTGTSVAVSPGEVVSSVGAVVSAGAVVNVQDSVVASALPEMSLTPVVRVTV
jgi:hypothetical protein